MEVLLCNAVLNLFFWVFRNYYWHCIFSRKNDWYYLQRLWKGMKYFACLRNYLLAAKSNAIYLFSCNWDICSESLSIWKEMQPCLLRTLSSSRELSDFSLNTKLHFLVLLVFLHYCFLSLLPFLKYYFSTFFCFDSPVVNFFYFALSFLVMVMMKKKMIEFYTRWLSINKKG